MAHLVGFIIGIIFISSTCGLGSYFLWEKQTQGEHGGKQVFFAFLCFFMGGVFGLIGGVPALTIYFFTARYYRNKIELSSEQRTENSKKAG